MAGLTTIRLDQAPRWQGPPGSDSRLREIDPGPMLKAILEWIEGARRRLQRSIPHYHTGSATFNPANLADGAGETTTVTVTGASLGDVAFCSFSLDTQGIILFPWVSATDTVSVRFQNESGGAVNLAEGTLKAWTFTPPSVA